MAEETLYTIYEVADKLRVKDRTIRRIIMRREMAAIIVGKQYRITEKAVQDYLQRQTIQPTEKE
jgi:excisionase family DNA binding protein